MVAAQAKHLTVFQRTANYSTPSRNRPLPAEEQRTFNARREQWQDEVRHTFAAMTGFPVPRSHYDDTPQQRRKLLEERWQAGGMPQSMLATYKNINVDEEANALVADFIRYKIRDIVKDAEIATILSPSAKLPIGSKRPPIDTNYYETFNRDNVTLVDVHAAPIECVTPSGIKTSEAQYDLDAIIFATGFDAMTGTLLAIDIRTRAGTALKDLWMDGPVSYLGLMVSGMPNLFMINGPGSPSVKVNIIVALEQHTDWIMGLVDHLRSCGQDRVEATDSAQAAWVEHTREVAEATLFAAPDSWYVGANIPGKKRVFMPYLGGFEKYWKLCEEIAADGYRGFVLSRKADARRDPCVNGEGASAVPAP